MFSLLIETFTGAFAELFVGKALEKGRAKHPKLVGWVSFVLFLIVMLGLLGLAVYLLATGEWAVSVLLFAIVALVTFLMCLPAYQKRKKERGA